MWPGTKRHELQPLGDIVCLFTLEGSFFPCPLGTGDGSFPDEALELAAGRFMVAFVTLAVFAVR